MWIVIKLQIIRNRIKGVHLHSLRSPVEAEDVGISSCVSRQVGELEAAVGGWRGRALAFAIIWSTLSMSPAWSIRNSSFEPVGVAISVGGNPSDRCYLLPVCIQTEIKGCLVASLWKGTSDRSPRCPLAPVPAWRFILQPISHLARILQSQPFSCLSICKPVSGFSSASFASLHLPSDSSGIGWASTPEHNAINVNVNRKKQYKIVIVSLYELIL